jgi:hypothetical protein
MHQSGQSRLFRDLPPAQRRFALLLTAVIGLIALGGIELTVMLLART